MWTGLCRAVGIALLIVSWAGSSWSTAAASEDASADATALYKQGIQASKQGRHLEAGALFVQAYERDPSPSLLWNAARSFDRAGDRGKAAALYERYQALPDGKPDKVQRARTWLETHSEAEPEETPEAGATPEGDGVLRVTAARDTSTGATSRVVGWTLCGTGIAAAVGGTVAMILAARSRDETYKLVWDEDYVRTLSTHDGLKSDTETRELVGWMAFGVSAALVSVGVTLLFAHTEDESPTLGLAPTSGGLSASGTWRF